MKLRLPHYAQYETALKVMRLMSLVHEDKGINFELLDKEDTTCYYIQVTGDLWHGSHDSLSKEAHELARNLHPTQVALAKAYERDKEKARLKNRPKPKYDARKYWNRG